MYSSRTANSHKRKRGSESEPQSILPTMSRASQHWSEQEDSNLQTLRARGGHWHDISLHFPGKSPNACRKRHERLQEKRRNDSLGGGEESEKLAKAYWEVREEMWTILANKMGDKSKWSTIETKCMEKGLHNLKTAARSHAREPRQASQGMDDDSGIGLSETEPSPDLQEPLQYAPYLDHPHRLPPLARPDRYAHGPTIASMLAPSSNR